MRKGPRQSVQRLQMQKIGIVCCQVDEVDTSFPSSCDVVEANPPSKHKVLNLLKERGHEHCMIRGMKSPLHKPREEAGSDSGDSCSSFLPVGCL